MADSYGTLCYVPVILVIVSALISRRSIESLLLGTAVGWILVSGNEFLWNMVDSAVRVTADESTVWVVIVCGLFGSLVAIIEKSGGVQAFGNYLATKAKNEKSSLLLSLVLGLLVFVDDYLNCLVIGSTMREVTDKHKVPREMLAYVIDCTAAPICVLVPVSTWAVYCSGLLENNGLAATGEGLKLYVQTVPFILYPMIAIVVVFLTIIGVIPKLGPMRTVYDCAHSGKMTSSDYSALSTDDILTDNSKAGHMVDFLLPMAVLVAITIIKDTDLLKGTFAALIVCLLLYLPRKLMRPNEAFDLIIQGFADMIVPIIIIIVAFMLKEVNDCLGLTPYTINAVKPYMNNIMLPALAFLVIACIGFCTGSNWGTWAIALPIVVPLAEAVGVNIPLVLGAMWSGGAFGSHACPWGDATVLASAGAGCDNMAHAKTQLPYAFIGAGATFVIYIIIAAVMR